MNFHPDTLVYIGRRMNGTQAVYGYVRDIERGKPSYWKKPLRRGLAIGQRVSVSLRINEHDRLELDSVDEVGPQISDLALVAEWSAADKVTSVELGKITQARRLARESVDPIDDAIAVLHEAYVKQRGIGARVAFVEYVAEAMRGNR